MADEPSEYVTRLAEAASLEALPPIADPVNRTPLNPPQHIQEKFVGSSYLAAFTEAETFVDRVFDFWPGGNIADLDVSAQTAFDFGSGWGRISRMLLRRLRPDQVWASDVDSEMTTLLHTTLPGLNAVTNAPWPPTVFRPAGFDVVTAFSVFSHLSEEAHREWAHEFGRLVRPGGRVFITVLEDDFLAMVAGAQAAVAAGEADLFAERLSVVVTDALSAHAAARRGEFVYAGEGADDDGPRSRSFYSWAVAPRSWVEKTWGEAGFDLVDFVPTGVLFDQAMAILQRRDDAAPAAAAPTPSLLRRAARKAKRTLRGSRS